MLTTLLLLVLILPNTPSSAQLLFNTSLSSEQPNGYIIYSSVEGSSRDSDNERIRIHLGMILAPAEVQEYGGDYTGVEFWHVVMSDMQRVAFKTANPMVSVS